MNTLLQYLTKKTRQFSIELDDVAAPNVQSWLENQLMANPTVLSEIASYSYRVVPKAFKPKTVQFSIRYNDDFLNAPVFVSQNQFEFITAISSSLRLHLSKAVFVIDNRKNSFTNQNYFQLYEVAEEFVGEELALHQNSSTSMKSRLFFSGKMMVLYVERNFFDSQKEVNHLSSFIAGQARQIREKTNNNSVGILNEVLYWFRNQVTYEKTNQVSDHSAVGLLKNGTAVCQGIAAYAYQLLNYCGIMTRYVSGEGLGPNGWELHGWNMVYHNNRWIHVDYTFELNEKSNSILKNELEFRNNHRWDESKYDSKLSSIIANSKKTFVSSILSFIPEASCFSINGCIVDFRNILILSIVYENNIRIDLLTVISLIGGSYSINQNHVSIFINGNQQLISMDQLVLKEGNLYMEISRVVTLGFSIKLEGNIISISYCN